MKCLKCQFENPADTNFCGKCAAPLPSLDGPQFGQTETIQTPSIRELTRGSTFAGRFEVIEELGKGGMGWVYKVFDRKIKEKIALKLLKPEISSDENAIERFGNELKFARKIAHRHVCRMFDLGEEKGTHYITMEYVSGEDLKSMLKMMGQMSAGKTTHIAKQVCEGLAEAHRLGVVHRDLKPQNIMIDREGNVRVMDFGIARSLKTKGLTGAGVVIGTPEYMSPEQMEGKDADSRSDIYSLGVILYEMVTGKLPFEGETFVSIALKQKTEQPRNPKEFNPQLPEDLNRLILKCLEKEKEKRYPGVEEILTDLGKIEKGMPTTEKALPSRKTLTSREITVKLKPHKLIIPGLALLALVVAAIILFPRIFHRKPLTSASGKPLVAIMYFKNNTADQNLDTWKSSLAEMLIDDLSQSKYIDVVSVDRIYSILRKLNLVEAKNYATEDLKEVAAQSGATHIVSGMLTKSGNSFRINITLQESGSLKPVASEEASGQGLESFYPMVDDLKSKIKRHFNLSPQEMAGDIDKKLENITTSSPEAYRYYSEGRKYHLRQEYQKSIEYMKKAIEIDPKFAMAYRSLGAAYLNLSLIPESEKYKNKALELSDRLPDRERLIIVGDVNYWNKPERNWGDAIKALNELLSLYPDDTYGNYYMGVIQGALENWDEAIKYYEICRKNKYEFYACYTQLANAYQAKGLYDKAKEALEFCQRNIADNAFTHNDLANNALAQGKFDEAQRELEKATLLDPTNFFNIILSGDIAFYRGDLAKAENEYQKLFEDRKNINALGSGFFSMSFLYMLQGKYQKLKVLYGQGADLAQKFNLLRPQSQMQAGVAYADLHAGNYDKALDESQKAFESAVKGEYDLYQRQALLYKGLAFLGKKMPGEAQKVAEELKLSVERGMREKDIRLYQLLRGMIELEKKNYSKAVEYLNEAVLSLPYGPLEKDALYLGSLALAYDKAGDLEKAREEYEKITALTTGKVGAGDIYAKSFYNLGKIYERKGDKVKAGENYQKFLSLWKDADANLPEPADAKKRLAALENR